MCKTTCAHKTMKAAGLLGLRLALAFIFIYSGYGKMFVGHEMASGMFSAKLGLPGSATAYFVGGLEVLGGLMVLLGVFAKYAATWLAVIMVVAILAVHRGGPVNGYFLTTSLLGACLAIMGVGAGPWRLVKTQCHCKMCVSANNCCAGEKKEGKEGDSCCGGKCGGSCAEKSEMCGCGSGKPAGECCKK